jgi:4-amino-4-deoxy-L-arabinose transferase-like glycosyltransferase
MKPRSIRLPALLLLALPVGLAWAWTGFCGYQGLNGQDAYDYLRIARAWTAWAHGGPMPRMQEHPHGYPIAGALLGSITGSEGLALRLLSAASLVVLALLFRGVLLRAFPQQRGQVDLFVLLAFVLAPFPLRQSMTVMSDMPALALLGVGFACTVRWASERRGYLLLAALAALLATAMRLAAAIPALLLALAVCIGPAAGRNRRLALVLAFTVVAALVLLLAVPWEGIRSLAAHSPVGDWSPWNLFRRELRSDDGVLHYRFPNLLYALGTVVHPGFLPWGALLLPFVRRADLGSTPARMALVTVAGYLLFMAGMPFQNDRVLLPVQPFLALLLFPAFVRALGLLRARLPRPRWALPALLAAVVAAQAALFARATLPFIRQARTERELAALVNAGHVRHVYTHGMGAALGSLCPGVEVTELWYGTLPRFEHDAWLVVQPANLQAQWQGRPPGINWEHAREQGLDTLLVRSDGWTVARVR